MAPRRAGALEAARRVDALVGTGLRKPLALIYVCPQHKETPAPGKDKEGRETGKKDGRKKRYKNNAEGKKGRNMKRTNEKVQATKIEEKDEDEGGERGYVNYPTAQQYIFMSLRQKCIETITETIYFFV